MVLGDVYRVYAEDLPIQWIYASIICGIDGIGITMDNVAEMIETVHSIVNVDMFAVRVDKIAAIDGVGDANMEVLQGLYRR